MKDYLLVFSGIVIGILLFYALSFDDNKTDTEIKIVRDTIIEIVTPDPIIIEKVKTKIRYIKDTIIQTKPFIASIDTVIQYDTIHCYYTYPENLLSLKILKAQDTLITHQINFLQTKVKNNPWWHDPLLILGGVVSGYAIKSMEN